MVTLTNDEWGQLIGLAQSSVQGDALRELASMLLGIERRNDITRYELRIRWTEVGVVLPSTAQFPAVWPGQYDAVIRKLDVPITREEVEQVVSERARRPVATTLVTLDPAGLVGWTQLDTHFA